MAPSPTAEATRFIESSRTSPAANTPGTLVSSAYGGRRQRPTLSGAERHQVLAGDEKAVVVADHVGTEPLSTRGAADEDEEPARGDFLDGSGDPLHEGEGSPGDRRRRCFHLSAVAHLDVGSNT